MDYNDQADKNKQSLLVFGKALRKVLSRVDIVAIWLIFLVLLTLNTINWFSGTLIPSESLLSIGLILVLGAISIFMTHSVTQQIKEDNARKHVKEWEHLIEKQNNKLDGIIVSLWEETKEWNNISKKIPTTQEISDPIFKKLALWSIEQAREKYSDILNGKVLYQYSELKEMIIESTSIAESEVIATHYICNDPIRNMWLKDQMQRNYLNSNFNVVRSGVNFERMFIVNNDIFADKQALDGVIQILDEHERGGVEVYVLFEKDYNNSWEEDMVIIDQKRLHVYYRGGSSTFEKVAVILDKQIVDGYIDRYNLAKHRAVQWNVLRKQLMSSSGYA